MKLVSGANWGRVHRGISLGRDVKMLHVGVVRAIECPGIGKAIGKHTETGKVYIL